MVLLDDRLELNLAVLCSRALPPAEEFLSKQVSDGRHTNNSDVDEENLLLVGSELFRG